LLNLNRLEILSRIYSNTYITKHDRNQTIDIKRKP